MYWLVKLKKPYAVLQGVRRHSLPESKLQKVEAQEQGCKHSMEFLIRCWNHELNHEFPSKLNIFTSDFQKFLQC